MRRAGARAAAAVANATRPGRWCGGWAPPDDAATATPPRRRGIERRVEGDVGYGKTDDGSAVRAVQAMLPKESRKWRGRDNVAEDTRLAVAIFAELRAMWDRGEGVDADACGLLLYFCAVHGVAEVALNLREWMAAVNIPSVDATLQHDAWTLRALTQLWSRIDPQRSPGKHRDLAEKIARHWEHVKWYHDFSREDPVVLSTIATQLFKADLKGEATAIVQLLRHRKARLTRCLWAALLANAPSVGEADATFNAMRREVQADAMCFVLMLDQCARHEDVDTAERYFEEAMLRGVPQREEAVWLAYLKVYTACGRTSEALRTFQHTPPQSGAYAALLRCAGTRVRGGKEGGGAGSMAAAAMQRFGDALIEDAAARGMATVSIREAWVPTPGTRAADAAATMPERKIPRHLRRFERLRERITRSRAEEEALNEAAAAQGGGREAAP